MTEKTYLDACARYMGTREGTAAHRALIDLYNRQRPLPRGYAMQPSDPWCAAFLTAVAVSLGWKDFPSECGCWQMAAMLRTSGRWHPREYMPRPGDLIFFSWAHNGVHDHVGVVESCEGRTVHTIEGNRKGAVDRASYAASDPAIIGYGTPHYELTSEELDTLATEVIRGRWGNGEDRRKRLAAAGYDYDLIQRRVNELLK